MSIIGNKILPSHTHMMLKSPHCIRRGFSFVHVQISVAVAALLTAIILPSLPRLTGKHTDLASSESAEVESDSAQVRTAQQLEGAIHQLDQAAVLGNIFTSTAKASPTSR